MEPVAYRGLRHLRDKSLGVTQCQVLQLFTRREFFLKNARLEPIATACALDHRPVRRRLAAHEKRNANQSLVASDGNFCRVSALRDVEQRHEGSRRKIHMAQMAARLVDS